MGSLGRARPRAARYKMRGMIRAALSLLLLTAVATVSSAQARREPPRNTAGFAIRRGVNLSHWLSQCFGWSPRDTFITEDDIRFIKRLGYDHVRIPIDEKELWTVDGQPSPAAFAALTRSLDWCQKHELRAIVDLHTVRAHHF